MPDELNAAIATLSAELAHLRHQRRGVTADAALDARITVCAQAIATLQRREGAIIRERMHAVLAGPLAHGWSLLRHAALVLQDEA